MSQIISRLLLYGARKKALLISKSFITNGVFVMCYVDYWQAFALGMILGAILGVLFCLATVERV